jgi:hypothetical protein
VAHTCNPSYSGGRDQEDRGSRQINTLSQKKPITKRTGGVAQGVGPEFKPQNRKNKTTTTTKKKLQQTVAL